MYYFQGYNSSDTASDKEPQEFKGIEFVGSTITFNTHSGTKCDLKLSKKAKAKKESELVDNKSKRFKVYYGSNDLFLFQKLFFSINFWYLYS